MRSREHHSRERLAKRHCFYRNGCAECNVFPALPRFRHFERKSIHRGVIKHEKWLLAARARNANAEIYVARTPLLKQAYRVRVGVNVHTMPTLFMEHVGI